MTSREKSLIDELTATSFKYLVESFTTLPFFFGGYMKVFITVREHEFHEDGYIVDKVFTDYKDAQDSLLQKGFRILDEEEELYLNEGRKDGYQYARIYHRTL